MAALTTTWAPIAVYSPATNRFEPLLGAPITQELARDNPRVEMRTINVGKRRVIQARAR